MIKFAAEPGRFETFSIIGFWGAGAVQGIIFLLLVLFAPIGERIFRLEPQDLIIAGAIPLVFWVRDWGFCVQQTLYQTARLFWIELVYWGGTSAGFIWFWLMGSGAITEIFVIIFSSALLSSLLAVIVWPRGIRITLRLDRPALAELFRYGIYTLGLGFSSSLLAGADLILLGAIYNSEIVGIYGGAKRIYSVVAALVSTVGLLVIPYASKLAAENRMADVRALYEKTVAYMVAGMGMAIGVGWVLAAPFYRYVMPEAYEKSIPLFRILLIAAPFEGLFYITTAILYGIGAASVTVVTSSLALGLLALLLPTAAYFFGTTGTAIAQVALTAFVGILMTWRAGQKVNGEWRSTVGRLKTAINGILWRLGTK